MAELADAADSKSADRKVMGVRFPLPAPSFQAVTSRVINFVVLAFSCTTLSHFHVSKRRRGGHSRWLSNTPFSAARFTSTNAQTAAAGSAPAISQARTA